MDREEAVDRKNLCNRIPISLRKKTIKLPHEEYPAQTSISSVILKTARTHWKRRLSQQTRVLPRWNPVGFYRNEPEVAGERLFEQF